MSRITRPPDALPPDRPDQPGRPEQPEGAGQTDRTAADSFRAALDRAAPAKDPRRSEATSMQRLKALVQQAASENRTAQETLEHLIEQELARAHGRPPGRELTRSLAETIEENRALSTLFQRVMSDARPPA